MSELRNFLLESRCARGHASSIAFTGYTTEQIHSFRELVAHAPCAWPCEHEEPCGARAEHTVIDLGSTNADRDAVERARRAETEPAMHAVQDPRTGVHRITHRAASEPPPPPPSGPLTAGE